MKKKIFYMGALGLILMGLLGPFIFPTKDSPQEAQLSAGQTTTLPISVDDADKGVNKTTNPANASDIKQEDSPAAPEKTELTKRDSQEESTVWAQLKVVGKNGEVILEPVQVQITARKNRDATVFDALAASGVPFEVSVRWPGMVESIAGLANKGQAGWMYQVNGETPLMGADKKIITSGDRIIWWYSQSVNSPPPK